MASKAQVQEIIKCGKDPNYFLEKYIKIQHPVRGLIAFKMYDFQKSCITDFIDNRFNMFQATNQVNLLYLKNLYCNL